VRRVHRLILAACSRVREVEPNDHFTKATSIPGTCKVGGTMATAADIDAFKLEVSKPGQSLDLHVGGIRDMDFVLKVMDGERRELKRYDETSSGGDERGLDIGLDPGAYYIELSNKNPKANNPEQGYALDAVLSSSEGREREPDDRALEATALRPGGVLRGHYYPSRNLLNEANSFQEEDWFKVEVPQEGRYLLNVDVSEVPGVDPVLEIYDLNSYMLKAVDTTGPGGAESFKGFGVKGPAQFHLRLRSKAANAANAEVRYEMLSELVPYQGSYEFEPNDQRLDATPFDGETMQGTVSPVGDADWYKFTVAGDSRRILGVTLGGLIGMDLKMTFADDIGRPLLEIDNAGEEQSEVLTGVGLMSGDTYLIVAEKTGKKAEPRRAYTLTRTLVEAQPGLEFELNNSSASAQPLQVGSSVDGSIAPKGDEDWYEFNVYAKGQVVTELTGVLNVTPAMELFDPDGNPLAQALAKKPGEGLTLSKELDPGTYQLKLKPQDPKQVNVRDKYTLRIRGK